VAKGKKLSKWQIRGLTTLSIKYLPTAPIYRVYLEPVVSNTLRLYRTYPIEMGVDYPIIAPMIISTPLVQLQGGYCSYICIHISSHSEKESLWAWCSTR